MFYMPAHLLRDQEIYDALFVGVGPLQVNRFGVRHVRVQKQLLDLQKKRQQ